MISQLTLREAKLAASSGRAVSTCTVWMYAQCECLWQV